MDNQTDPQPSTEQSSRRPNALVFISHDSRDAEIAEAFSRLSKYPPAKPGALICEPLEAAVGVANAAPISLSHLTVASQRNRFN